MRSEPAVASEPKSLLVSLFGQGTTPDGRHGLLGFKRPSGEQFLLAFPIEQTPNVVTAGTMIDAEAREKLGAKAPPPATFPIERWSMVPGDDDTTVLTFHLTGGAELRLVVTSDTVRDDGGDMTAPPRADPRTET